jgi:hypothetical protein
MFSPNCGSTRRITGPGPALCLFLRSVPAMRLDSGENEETASGLKSKPA